MSAIGHQLRAIFTRRLIATEPTVIVWWGSGPRGATIGDLLAVRNLSAGLAKRGHAHSIISHPRFAEPGHVVTDDLARLRAGIETIVFACGPLVGTSRLWFLLGRYPRARKFAVGVSVLPHEGRLNRRFSGFVARDGMTPAHFDLSIDAVEPPAPPPAGRPIRAGLCFRGPQKEYRGRDCLADRAEAMLTAAARRCGLETMPFTTVLGGNRAAADVLESFRSFDVVLTTRLHGSLLAIAAGKPVIAIDQIAGGAKLLPVLARSGWRHVLPVDAADEERTGSILRGFLDAWPSAEIVTAQHHARALSRAAVEASVTLISAGP